MKKVYLLGGLALALFLGCEGRSFEDPPPRAEKLSTKLYPQSIEKEVDLLFVVDNSLSMADEQENLRKNFGKLIDALRLPKLEDAIPNVHIGVVSSDLGAGNFGGAIEGCADDGDGGRLQYAARAAGCKTPTDPWISYEEGRTNVPGCDAEDPVQCVKEAFSCIAKLGVEGCGYEQQLEAAYRALDPKRALNPGFLRDNALLAVVFITDEDDCSAAKPELFDPTQKGLTDPLGPATSFRCFEFGIQCDVNERRAGARNQCVPAYDWLHDIDKYIRFFRELKGNADRVIMAAIAGPSNPVQVVQDDARLDLAPSCRHGGQGAAPAIRINRLVEALGGQLTSICTDDFGPALQTLGKKIVTSLGGQCITSPLLVPNGGVACKAGVDRCQMPSCPATTSCDSARGVCLDADGQETVHLCGMSCLDKVDCQLSQITGRGTAREQEVQLKKCPSALFDPALPKEQCGDHCPCWRILPRTECTAELGVSPFGFDVMRKDPAPPGAVAVARCRAAPYSWAAAEVQQASMHCAAGGGGGE